MPPNPEPSGAWNEPTSQVPLPATTGPAPCVAGSSVVPMTLLVRGSMRVNGRVSAVWLKQPDVNSASGGIPPIVGRMPPTVGAMPQPVPGGTSIVATVAPDV